MLVWLSLHHHHYNQPAKNLNCANQVEKTGSQFQQPSWFTTAAVYATESSISDIVSTMTNATMAANAVNTAQIKEILTHINGNNVRTRHNTKEEKGNGFRREPGKFSYCHSHGITNNLANDSFTCTNPSEGHIVTATMENKCGGSLHNWDKGKSKTANSWDTGKQEVTEFTNNINNIKKLTKHTINIVSLPTKVISDTEETGYFMESDAPIYNKIKFNSGINVLIPNG